MNEEFLVDPKGFKSALQLKIILGKFGFFKGRFIGELPKCWIREVYDHIADWPDVEKKKVRCVLEKKPDKSRDYLVSSGQPYLSSLSWIENAHQQVEQKNFVGVVAAHSNQWKYPTTDDIYEDVDDEYLKGGHDVRILGKAQYYTDITRRLLQKSHEIVLVDPYLHLDEKKRERVIASFLEVAQQGKCRSFVIWAREEKSGMKGYQKMLEQKYKPKLVKGSRLMVKLVDDSGSVEQIHARLMLSNLGGFRFDKGFEEFSNRKVDVAILDKKTHDDHSRWYLDPGSPNDFEIVEEHVVEG